MICYFIHLYDINYKEDIILALTSAGLSKIIFLEGTNGARLLETQLPIFTGFFRSSEEKEKVNGLFIGMIDGKDKLEAIKKLLKDSGVENKNNDVYQIFYIEGNSL